MFIEPIHTEHVFNASEQMLRSHFNSFFGLFCENQDDPNASSEIIDGLARHVSNIPSAALNAVVGTPEDNADASIEEQVAYFKKLEIPFVWYVDESTDPTFKTKLIEHGFQELGVYQGVIKDFDEPFSDPDMPEGCTIEVVKTEEMMETFNEIVCTTFGIDGESKNLYKKGLWDLATKEPYTTCHWIAKKNGIVVSALTSFIQGPIVSFWNEVSVPEIRRHGYSTAIVKTALQDAISKGCNRGSAYLMPDCLALGIYTRLGYKTKWRFNAFLYKLRE